MLGVANQYQVKFNIKNPETGEVVEDFLTHDEFLKFTVIEEAGNILPQFEQMFTISDSSIIDFLNEGNVLEYTYGKTQEEEQEDFSTTSFRILKKTISKLGAGRYQIYLNGLYDALPYISDCAIEVFSSRSGIETIEEVVSKFFLRDFGVHYSSDAQTWLQHNISHKKFINNVWMHSYLKDSFVALGIASDGTFILKDLMRDINNHTRSGTKPDWRFKIKPTEDIDVLYDADYAFDVSSGFLNSWLGYENSKSIRTIETAVDNKNILTLRPVLSLSNNLDRDNQENNVVDQFGLLNDNVHGNYWKAYYQNLSNLAILGVVQGLISYTDRMLPKMRVLDLVYFSDSQTDNPDFISEEFSGLYYITKLSRVITNMGICTTVILNREVLGEMKGDLR